MIDLSAIATLESPTDTISFLIRNRRLSYKRIDLFFRHLNSQVIYSGELASAIEAMIESKALELLPTGGFIQGENWAEPEFVTLGKYGIAEARKEAEQG